MPAYPIVRLGCTTIDPRQAYAYWMWAQRNGQLPAACCAFIDEAGGCWADAPTTAYADPTTDCASWIDLAYPESADFLGVYLTAVQGLDDPVSSRSSVQNVDGGATATAPVVTGRGIRLKGYLVADSCAGMEWGKQWLRRTLDEVCRWGTGASTGACATGTVSVRVFCPPDGGTETDGIRDLVNVWMADAPTFQPITEALEERQCTCYRMAFEVVLLAGNPAMYRQPATVIARTAFSGALDYTALPAPVPVTAPTEPVCIAAPAPPPADAALPEYDNRGRPSCGPGSGYYQSAAEVVTEDELGHPSFGDGSGLYMRTQGEYPVLDWMGRPSCGTGSANYAALAATTSVTNEQLYTTNTVAQWTERTTSVAALTWAQANAATFRWTGTGRVRNVRLKTYALNEFSPVPSRNVADKFYGGLQTLTFTGSSALPGSSTQYAYSYTVEITWEERIDATQSVTLDWSVTSFSSAAGPNAGVDRACTAPVAGPNAGVDRAQVTECVSRLVMLPWKVFPTLDPSDTNHPMAGSDTVRAIPLLADEGDRIFGTLSANGDAKFTVRFNPTDYAPVNQVGVQILWRRLRVRFATPKGPNNAAYPWTIGSVGHGGRFDSMEVYDGTTDVIFPMTSVVTDEIDVDLAGPIGGTEGWIDYMAMEIEYVGVGADRDCGPNNGVDVDCTAAATTNCYVRPATVALASGRFVAPTVATAAPIFTIEAGTADLTNVALFAWPDPLNRTAPTADQAALDFWRGVAPCMAGEIPWVPAGGTLTIDTRARTVTLTVGGFTVEASRYLTGVDGGVWTWPVWSGAVRALVVAPSTVSASARATVTAAIAEGV